MQFNPRNATFLADAGYLEAKNRCNGWSNTTLGADLQKVPKEKKQGQQQGQRKGPPKEAAILGGGRPGAVVRNIEGRQRLSAADVARINLAREALQQKKQEYAARATAVHKRNTGR